MIDRLLALLGQRFESEQLELVSGLLTEQPEELQIEGETYFSFKDAGISLLRDPGGLLTAIHLYLVAGNGFRPYRGPLPLAVSDSAGRSEIRALLGAPAAVGEAGRVGYLGATPSWDRYSFPDFTAHFQYSAPGDKLGLVTLMSSAATPSR
jgi:hypothetical protein